MKTDRNLEKDIQDAFKWDPLLKAAEVTILANDALITLSGVVESYSDKLHAANITKSIAGVKAVIDHITIDTVSYLKTTDEEIAENVLHHLKLNSLPIERIQIEVENGHVTLNGQVTYNFQKEDAKKAVAKVKGVRFITNNLKLIPETHGQLEKRVVEHALLRYSATVDQNISVKVEGNVVTLNGTLTSLYQKEEVVKMAWNDPGVSAVNNKFIIA